MLDQSFENLERKKRDLSLVVITVIVKTIAADPMSGDTLDLRDLDQRIIVGRPAVMAKVVMAARNEQVADQHLKTRNYPTRKRISRMIFVPKRCFSFRRISVLEICSNW